MAPVYRLVVVVGHLLYSEGQCYGAPSLRSVAGEGWHAGVCRIAFHHHGAWEEEVVTVLQRNVVGLIAFHHVLSAECGGCSGVGTDDVEGVGVAIGRDGDVGKRDFIQFDSNDVVPYGDVACWSRDGALPVGGPCDYASIDGVSTTIIIGGSVSVNFCDFSDNNVTHCHLETEGNRHSLASGNGEAFKFFVNSKRTP